MNRDLRGKTALVTGGTDGVGKAIARGLANVGSKVIVVGRDLEKGNRAASEVRQSTDNPAVEFIGADVSLMTEVNRLANELGNRTIALRSQLRL
jgi:short-subunit dehydrogenase